MPISITEIRDILCEEINCPPLDFLVTTDGRGVTYFQVVNNNATDNVTGKPCTWKGRKWLLSQYMTKGEIVQTAFKAVLTAMEHEIRETFTYKGASIFDPHYDIDKLLELRQSSDAIKERD